MNILELLAQKHTQNINDFNPIILSFCLLPQDKLKKIKSTVLDNIFIQDGQKIYYFSIFTKIQRSYWAFSKLAQLWRWKKARQSSVDTDLYLNSLNSFKDVHKVQFLQNKTIYEFRITDIVNLWMKSLLNHMNLRPAPCLPKNPYTNITFSKAELIHFYNSFKSTSFAIPPLIEKFYRLNLDIEAFLIECYPELIDKTVDGYISDSADQMLFLDIINMVARYKRCTGNRSISVNLSDIHKNHIITILKPILKYHLLSTYSCNPLKRKASKAVVKQRLRELYEKNPRFGRRYVHVQRSRTVNIPAVPITQLDDPLYDIDDEDSARSNDSPQPDTDGSDITDEDMSTENEFEYAINDTEEEEILDEEEEEIIEGIANDGEYYEVEDEEVL